jgi:uncharacterized membrane protein YvlD (DUF360 family)
VRRLGLRILLSLAASAIGLVICALLLDDFEISVETFPFAVLLFGIANAIVEPIVAFALVRSLHAAIGLIALLANAFTLWLTDIVSTGIDVRGVGTFALATLVMWIVNVVLELVPGPWRRQQRLRRR